MHSCGGHKLQPFEGGEVVVVVVEFVATVEVEVGISDVEVEV